ncbi:MAG: response regulator transcription factor [Tissierellia bacterium]|nr:response regulator transcription factor [Tissierellia bacterium]
MKKILIIEDDRSISEGLKFYFKNKGLNVSSCASIYEAKRLLMDGSFDLIIMDLGLPDGNGFELARYIRTFSGVAIVFLTAIDEQESLYKGFELGGDDYVTKPFSIKELYLRVNSILKRQDFGPMKKIRKSGQIKLDKSSRKVYKDNLELELTPTEYKLLNYFIDNPNIALSRDDILKNIWDINEDIRGDNTISVYIKRLREKIEDNLACPQYIQTIRKVGYMWDKEVD